MSFVERNYRVEHLIINPPNPTIVTDITDKVVSLDKFHLNSTGKISTAAFTLNAEHGDFITQDNGGTTPLLQQFDKIRIVIIDDNGFERQSRIFELTTDLAQLANSSDYFLPLELEGRERNVAGIAYSGFFRDPPLNFHDIIEDIVNTYITTINPVFQNTLTTFLGAVDQNEAPEFNPQIWDFSNIDNCYDAIDFVVSQLNLSVSAGGGGNRFAAIYLDDPSNDNNMILRVIVQGSNNSGAVPTIEQNEVFPITNVDKVKLPSSGTQVIVRGRPKTGHLYSDLDKFVGRLEFYRNIPFYDSTVTYPPGVYVRQGTARFQSNTIVTPGIPPPAAQWTPIDVGDFVGFLNYSPITKGRLNEVINSFANQEGGVGIDNFDRIAIPDSNLTIRDKDPVNLDQGTNREFVLFRTNTDDLSGFPNKQRYLFANTDYIEGTQILVDPELGVIGGIFAADTYGTGAGNDPNGRAYENSVVIFLKGLNISGNDGDWIVFREAEEFDQVAVHEEGKNYEFNSLFAQVNNRNYPGQDRRRGAVPGILKWRPIHTQFLGNDCWHSPVNIEQVDGLFADIIENDEPLNDPANIPYKSNSGVKIEFGYNALNLDGPFEFVWKQLLNVLVGATAFSAVLVGLAASLFLRLSSPDYTSLGWWWAIGFPYPFTTHNAIPLLGGIYGTSGALNDLDAHRYLDLFNITRTVTGRRGYNNTDSDSLMEITGFDILMNFDITAAGNTIPFTGNIPFTHWAIDKFGTKWKSPKKFLRHLRETDKLLFEYGDLSPVYFSRTPLGINNIIENILVPEIEKNAVLFKENILMEGLQCELGYDDIGRYAPNLFETVIKPTFFQFFGGGSDDIRFTGIIDVPNWIKTPIAISRFNPTSKRIIHPDIQDYPNVVNIEQLQRIADNNEQVETFQFEQWTITRGGAADLNLEDSIFFKDPQLVRESDDPGIPNTRLLPIREMIISVPKGQGLTQKLVTVVKIT